MVRRFGMLLLLITGPFSAGAQTARPAADYTIGPTPGWVVATTPGTAGADQVSQGVDGVAYLLTDTQVLATGSQRVSYQRLVSTALNASGVESLANIQIPFDPSYQTLVLHAITIVRHGQAIPKLATARIQVLQREAELEARIYDGAKTINVFLDDVRAGDTIDYSYSRIGRNPVFKGSDFGTMLMQYSMPVARIHQRLLLPIDKPVVFAPRNTDMHPSISQHDAMRDYVWDVRNAPAMVVESGAPSWYMPFATVQWSEFADWAAVARWALPLYQVPATLDPALQAQVDRIIKAEPTPAGRMLAALRLVQGDIRYLGVEIGQNSHAPNPPSLVFARRFGDCKDKTLLTLTLLSHLGVEAHAALVNTRAERGLADMLPNPGAFDHVLVQAMVDGKIWWIDPTRYTQKADLDHLVQSDFGLALVVAPDTTALAPMKRAYPLSSSRRIHAVFDASGGFDKPVPFTVQTTTRGNAADYLRALLSSTNLTDMQKSYLNFYAYYYPQIKVSAPMTVSDDEAGNSIFTAQTYTIPDVSTASGDSGERVMNIAIPDFVNALRDPPVTVRKSPLRVSYPMDLNQRTEVLLPRDWPITANATTIDDPAFRFEQSEKLDGRRLIITDHFQSLADEVRAQDMARYLSDLARARNIEGYHLAWRKASGVSATTSRPGAPLLERINWLLVVLGLGMCGFAIRMAVAAYRFDPAPTGTPDRYLVGIAGWLVLLAVVLSLRWVINAYTLTKFFKFMSVSTWSVLTAYGSASYNALWAPLLLLEMLSAIAQLVLSTLLLVLFFKRRSSFPRMAIGYLIAALLIDATDHLLAGLIPAHKAAADANMMLIYGFFGASIWVAYLLMSRRVQSTFVRRYRPIAPTAAPPPPPPPPGPPPLWQANAPLHGASPPELRPIT
jgi:transglutaminase-like putative cysteine protease